MDRNSLLQSTFEIVTQIQRLHTIMAILMQNIKYDVIDRDTGLGS